jgi:hypothetical protein
MLALLQSEDTAPSLTLEYWALVIMRQTVGILALEVGFAILPVKILSVIASPAAGRAVAVFAGTSEIQQWMGLIWKVQTSSFESKYMPRKLDFYK